jgi:hypothetical protein
MTTRKALTLLACALVIALGITGILQAGPLTESEVIRSLGGVPVPRQNLACTSAAASDASALPPSSMVRIAAEGGGLYYMFGPAGYGLTINGSVYLPQDVVEVVQSPTTTSYMYCITRTPGTATLNSVFMR